MQVNLVFDYKDLDIFMVAKSAFLETEIPIGFASMVESDTGRDMVLSVMPQNNEQFKDFLTILNPLTPMIDEDADFCVLEDVLKEEFELLEKLKVKNPQKYAKGKKLFLHDYDGYYITPEGMYKKGAKDGYMGSLVNPDKSKNKWMVNTVKKNKDGSYSVYFKRKYNKGWNKDVCGRDARVGPKGRKFNYNRPCKSGEGDGESKEKEGFVKKVKKAVKKTKDTLTK